MLITMEPINVVFFPQTQALLSLVLVVGATILFRRVGRWPALLILIGSAGYFIMHVSNAVLAYTVSDSSSPSSALLRWWSLLDNVAGVATVCLPIGLLAFALMAHNASNQTLQPTAGRSDV